MGLDTLGDDSTAELATQVGDRRDDTLLDRLAIDVAHERHVELDDLGLERRQCTERGVTRTEIVDGDTVAETAQHRDARRASRGIEPRALGDLQNHAARDLAEPGVGGEQLLVRELEAMNVDEQQRVRRGVVRGFRDGCTHGATELVDLVQALGRRDEDVSAAQ